MNVELDITVVPLSALVHIQPLGNLTQSPSLVIFELELFLHSRGEPEVGRQEMKPRGRRTEILEDGAHGVTKLIMVPAQYHLVKFTHKSRREIQPTYTAVPGSS